MDFELSEEQRAIAATVRDFVRRELVPHEDLVERLDAVPEELAQQIRGKAIAAGLYAANFPAELGGGGLDALGLTLAERELGWTSWALQTLVSRPSNILQACRDGQVETYLLPAVRGERHRAGPAGRALGDIGLPGRPRHPRVHHQPRRASGLTPRLPPL